MSRERGLKIITFTLVVIAGICCAIISAAIIKDDAKSTLAWKQQEYERRYRPIENLPDRLILELHEAPISELRTEGLLKVESVSKLRTQGLTDKEIRDYLEKQIAKYKAKQVEAKKELIKGKESFWLRCYVLCGVGGLIGGAFGFFLVLFIYKMIEWIVVSFLVEEPKSKQ